MRFLNRYGLSAMNMQMDSLGPVDTFFSHNGNSTIDYIVIPEYMRVNVSDCCVSAWDPLNTSDHLDIRLSLHILSKTTCPVHPNGPGRIKWDSQEVRRRYFLNSQEPLRELRNRIISKDITPNLIDTYLNELTGALHSAAADLSHTKYVKHFKPYWNAELSRLKKIKVNTYRIWVNAGRPPDPYHPLMVAYKSPKKTFASTIKRIAKQYENDEICRAVRLAEVDRNSFWCLVKCCRNSSRGTNISIKRLAGVVVNNLTDVLEVILPIWAPLRTRIISMMFTFEKLLILLESTTMVMLWMTTFYHNRLQQRRLTALKSINKGKAAGYDQISAEPIVYASETIEVILQSLYNAIRYHEAIPVRFRTGIQIPLFRGKDLDILDPNNYRGITLLSTFKTDL